MEDGRVWEFEESLWKADAAHYIEAIDDDCLMVLPHPPFVLSGSDAVASVSDTPRWTSVEFSDQRVARPQEGLIVVAYAINASRDKEQPYQAHCTSTYRRIAHDEWRVVQHQQMPKLAIGN
jgi:hypothetical protein